MQAVSDRLSLAWIQSAPVAIAGTFSDLNVWNKCFQLVDNAVRYASQSGTVSLPWLNFSNRCAAAKDLLDAGHIIVSGENLPNVLEALAKKVWRAVSALFFILADACTTISYIASLMLVKAANKEAVAAIATQFSQFGLVFVIGGFALNAADVASKTNSKNMYENAYKLVENGVNVSFFSAILIGHSAAPLLGVAAATMALARIFVEATDKRANPRPHAL